VRINHPDIDFDYIEKEEEYTELFSELSIYRNGTLLAIDTESYPLIEEYGDKACALDCHTSRVRLISIYCEGIVPTVIDCQKVDAVPLLLLLKKKFVCIAHNALHDINALRSSFGIELSIKCTLVALCTLSVSTGWKASLMRGKGLKDMARDFFSIHLKKELATSDWANPYLSKDQLAYSAIDVSCPKSSSVKSILIEAYTIIKNTCDTELGESFAFDLDQDMVPILADMAYEGLPMKKDLISLSIETIEPLIKNSMKELCNSLSIPIEERVTFVNGSFNKVLHIPPASSKLLNNSRELVKILGEATRKSGIPLSDVQSDTLLNFIKELEKVEDEEDEEEDSEGSIKDHSLSEDIALVRLLLDYKKFSKMKSELEKYISNLNPVTGNLHSGTNVIGTSTGRMSSKGIGKAKVNLQQIGTLPFTIHYKDASQLFDLNN
jgi:hypothetical protein